MPREHRELLWSNCVRQAYVLPLRVNASLMFDSLHCLFVSAVPYKLPNPSIQVELAV